MLTLRLLLVVSSALALARPSAAQADQVLELALSTPPHAPGDAPDVVVHVPSRFSATRPVTFLIFLHGFSSCARALLASHDTACTSGGTRQRGYGLAALHEQAPGNTLLVVPQLAFLQRRAGSPRFERAGGFDAFLRDVSERLGGLLEGAPTVADTTLLAHSAGYRAAAQILRDQGSRNVPRNVVLFDALYASWDIFARWLLGASERRLISLHTRDAQTRRGNQQLRRTLAKAPGGAAGQPTRQTLQARLLIAEVATAHRLVPERHMLAVLRALFVTGDANDALPGAARLSAPAR